jgi:hypothetical protein
LGLSVFQQVAPSLFPLQWRFVTTHVNRESWGLYIQVGDECPPSFHLATQHPIFAQGEQRRCEQVEQPRDAIQRYHHAPVESLLRRGNDLTPSQVSTQHRCLPFSPSPRQGEGG